MEKSNGNESGNFLFADLGATNFFDVYMLPRSFLCRIFDTGGVQNNEINRRSIVSVVVNNEIDDENKNGNHR